LNRRIGEKRRAAHREMVPPGSVPGRAALPLPEPVRVEMPERGRRRVLRLAEKLAETALNFL